MQRKLMYWHERRLLGNAKLENQLVTNVWEPGNCLEVIPDALVKVFLREVRIFGALLSHNVGPLCETNVLRTQACQAEQCWTAFRLSLRKWIRDHWLEARKRERKELLWSKLRLVRHNVSCDTLWSFFRGDLDSIGLFQAFLNELVWHAIGAKRIPVPVPAKLECWLNLENIGHHLIKGLALRVGCESKCIWQAISLPTGKPFSKPRNYVDGSSCESTEKGTFLRSNSKKSFAVWQK